MLRPLVQKVIPNPKMVAPLLFVINVLLVYAGWKLFLFFATGTTGILPRVWQNFNDVVAATIVQQSSWVLQHVLGYDLVYNARNIIIKGTRGYFVADHCIGIAPCVIFAGFIAAFDGPWRHKLWYIPLGILLIFYINVLRVIMLGYAQVEFGNVFFELMHTRYYLITSYGLFFLLVMYWMNKYGSER